MSLERRTHRARDSGRPQWPDADTIASCQPRGGYRMTARPAVQNPQEMALFRASGATLNLRVVGAILPRFSRHRRYKPRLGSETVVLFVTPLRLKLYDSGLEDGARQRPEASAVGEVVRCGVSQYAFLGSGPDAPSKPGAARSSPPGSSQGYPMLEQPTSRPQRLRGQASSVARNAPRCLPCAYPDSQRVEKYVDLLGNSGAGGRT